MCDTFGGTRSGRTFAFTFDISIKGERRKKRVRIFRARTHLRKRTGDGRWSDCRISSTCREWTPSCPAGLPCNGCTARWRYIYIVHIVRSHRRATLGWRWFRAPISIRIVNAPGAPARRVRRLMSPRFNRRNVYSTACASLALFRPYIINRRHRSPRLSFKWTLGKRCSSTFSRVQSGERNRTIVAYGSNCCSIRREWLEFDENFSYIFTSTGERTAELLPNRITLFARWKE